MSTIEITKTNFNDVISKNQIVLLDFWADWCSPCKMFGPVFEKVASKNPDIVFGKVNTEMEEELSSAFNIRSIPTLMAFKDGVMLLNQAGSVPENSLEGLVKQIKEVNIEKLKQEKLK